MKFILAAAVFLAALSGYARDVDLVYLQAGRDALDRANTKAVTDFVLRHNLSNPNRRCHAVVVSGVTELEAHLTGTSNAVCVLVIVADDDLLPYDDLLLSADDGLLFIQELLDLDAVEHLWLGSAGGPWKIDALILDFDAGR